MKKKSGFTIAEVIITAVISAMMVAGFWAMYVIGHDFYQNAMHALRVQSFARKTSEAMLYGLNGDGILQANAFNVAESATQSDIAFNNRNIHWDTANWQISYTENATPLNLTPAYVQADGGIAVTYFRINNPADADDPIDANVDKDGDGNDERTYITFRIEALRPNTNPDPASHGPDDVLAEVQLTISARGRMI